MRTLYCALLAVAAALLPTPSDAESRVFGNEYCRITWKVSKALAIRCRDGVYILQRSEGYDIPWDEVVADRDELQCPATLVIVTDRPWMGSDRFEIFKRCTYVRQPVTDAHK